MGNISIRNGTPVGNCSLCDSCDHAHIINGYGESEVLVYCDYLYHRAIPIPFKVRQCSSYRDKNRPSWDQMEKLAIVIENTDIDDPMGFRYEDDDERERIAACTTIANK